MKALALAIDYDGVIVDSRLKSLFLGYNAYNRLNQDPNDNIFGVKFITFKNWEKVRKESQSKIKKYNKLRPYIKVPSDFSVIVELLKNDIIINSQKDFDMKKNH